MTRLLRLSLCVFAIFALESCVYYNTFYNAKKKYKQAEDGRSKSEADPENRGLKNTYRNYYLIAIRKASTILQLHPDSDWVDDSLLLMGRAYYWREEHSDAVQKFNELVENFPESPHLPEARYWLGLSLWGREDLAEARSTLSRVGQGSGTYAWHARLALAELEFAQNNIDAAIDLFQGLLEGEKDERPIARVWRGLGNAHFDRLNLDASLEAYQNVLLSDPDDVTNFQTRQQIGHVHEMKGDFEAALETYDNISRIKRFKDYEPRVRLMKANVLTLRSQIDDAIVAYEAIIKQYPRTEHSAEAYYQLGVIDYRTRRDSESAMENLKAARLERGGTTAAERAGAMENTLFLLGKVRKQSEREGKRGLVSLFDLAELYLFNLGEVDSAVATYERALTRAEEDDPHLAPKALYAIALIQADSLKDEESAHATFTRLVDDYPVTPYAIEARNRIGANRSDDLLAEARYLEAEALREEGEPVEDVITILEQVTEEYPNSLFAPQALYALGWTYENELQDVKKAASRYETLVEQYPTTEFAIHADEKLKKGDIRKALKALEDAEKEKANGKEEEKKTEGSGKVSETTSDLKSSKPDSQQVARPLEATEVDSPPELITTPKVIVLEGIGVIEGPPIARLRVLVDERGRVIDAEIVEAHEILQEKALESVRTHRYRPGKLDGKPRRVWVDLTVTFDLNEADPQP
jgi:TonB family protein